MGRLPPENMMFPHRGAALRGVGVVRQGRSGQVFSTWPKPRGKARSAAQQQAQDDFRAACVIVKNMDPLFQIMAAEVAKTGALLPRDILMMSLYGRLGYIQMPDGRKLFSVAAYQDVSLLLDAIAQVPGDLLLRGDSFWERLPKGSIGDNLVIAPDGSIQWEPAAVATPIEWFQQPRPMEPDNAGTAVTNNAYVGIAIYAAQQHDIQNTNVFVQSLTGTWNLSGVIYDANPSTLALTGGLLLANGVPQVAAAGLNVLPFAAPVRLLAGHFYYMGLWMQGGSSIKFMPTQETSSTRYFIQTATTPPSTAPTQNLLNERWCSEWLT